MQNQHEWNLRNVGNLIAFVSQSNIKGVDAAVVGEMLGFLHELKAGMEHPNVSFVGTITDAGAPAPQPVKNVAGAKKNGTAHPENE